MFGLHKDEHLDALVNLVKRVTEGVVAVAGHRIFKVPRQCLASPWKGLAFLSGFVAKGDDIVEAFTRELFYGFAAQAAGINGEMIEGGIGSWVDHARLSSSAEGLEVLTVGVPKQRFGKLGASGVGGTNKQDADLVSHLGMSGCIWFFEYTFFRINFK